jgi:hypothetical protein
MHGQIRGDLHEEVQRGYGHVVRVAVLAHLVRRPHDHLVPDREVELGGVCLVAEGLDDAGDFVA